MRVRIKDSRPVCVGDADLRAGKGINTSYDSKKVDFPNFLLSPVASYLCRNDTAVAVAVVMMVVVVLVVCLRYPQFQGTTMDSHQSCTSYSLSQGNCSCIQEGNFSPGQEQTRWKQRTKKRPSDAQSSLKPSGGGHCCATAIVPG